MGALESSKVFIGYNYCMELIDHESRTYYGTLWNVNEGLVYLWGTIYFSFISKWWFPFVAFGFMLTVISTVGVYFFPESPPYLL
jgi:hypothetical protein